MNPRSRDTLNRVNAAIDASRAAVPSPRLWPNRLLLGYDDRFELSAALIDMLPVERRNYDGCAWNPAGLEQFKSLVVIPVACSRYLEVALVQ